MDDPRLNARKALGAAERMRLKIKTTFEGLRRKLKPH
jgi:hypothetical protein